MDGTLMDETLMDGTFMDGTLMDGPLMDGTLMDTHPAYVIKLLPAHPPHEAVTRC